MREKLDACLSEYTRLWAEVRQKWESQQHLTNQLVYLTVALAAVSWFILSQGGPASSGSGQNASNVLDRSSLEWARRAWLAIPFLFSTMGLLVAYHDRGIRLIAAYVYGWLRPQVEQLIADSPASPGDYHVWHWDVFWYPELGAIGDAPKDPLPIRAWSLFTDFWYSGAKYGLTLVPSAGALALWAVEAQDKGLWWIAFGLSAALVLVAMLAGAFESWMYIRVRRIAVQHMKNGRDPKTLTGPPK